MLAERIGPGALLRAALAMRGTILAPLTGHWRSELSSIRETRRRTRLLMCDAAALQILICVRAASALDGVMVEAGVFMGGSARLICEAKGLRPLHLFDVFETLQAPGGLAAAEAAPVRAHFGRTHGRRAEVEELLAAYPAVRTHPGVFPGTASAVADERFSFVHLDLDLADSTAAALAFFHPRMLAGAILLADDYHDPGVQSVFTAYFSEAPERLIELPWGQVMVVKQ